MSNQPMHRVLHHLRQAVDPANGAGLTDAQLVERFATNGDEAAFEVLLWRHGPMVLNLCRRILRHEQDAEDAFQATFLILMRKAGGIGKAESVGAWLHKVAYRVALEAQHRAQRQRAEPLVDVAADNGPDAAEIAELKAIVDREIAQLPTRYRVPFVLCQLQERTLEEAARELDRPLGTVASWLARAREKLRQRLQRYGLALPAGALAVLGLPDLAVAGLPAPLVQHTLQLGTGAVSASVQTLTHGVLQAMFWSKVKLTAALVLTLGLGVGAVSYPAWAGSGRPVAQLARESVAAQKSSLDKVPPELRGFVGQVVGKLVSKQPEKGSLVLEVVQVRNVWKKNTAKTPKAAEGKTLQINGVFGKFIDSLETLKVGDGVIIEVKHVQGDALNFLGEQLKKTDLPK